MRRTLLSMVLALVVALPVAGCAQGALDPVEAVDPPSPTAEPTAEPEPGSAEALLASFQETLEQVDAQQDVPSGDEAVEALVEAGFERDAIERTADLDSLGEPVTLIEVAVRVDDACLVGQIGQGDPTSVVLPVLGSGTCLVGATVPVD